MFDSPACWWDRRSASTTYVVVWPKTTDPRPQAQIHSIAPRAVAAACYQINRHSSCSRAVLLGTSSSQGRAHSTSWSGFTGPHTPSHFSCYRGRPVWCLLVSVVPPKPMWCCWARSASCSTEAALGPFPVLDQFPRAPEVNSRMEHEPSLAPDPSIPVSVVPGKPV